MGIASSACRQTRRGLEGPLEGPCGQGRLRGPRCRPRRALAHMHRGGASCLSCPSSASFGALWTCCPPRAAGASSTRLSFLPSKMAPTASSPEAKLVVMSNSSLESIGGLLPILRTRSRQVVPSRKACTSDAWDLSAVLGKEPYEIPERLARSLGARPQVPGVPRAHVCALEVPHERADYVIPAMDLAGWQVFEPRSGRICEVQGRVVDDHRIGGGAAQLASQVVVVEPHSRVFLPQVLGDGGGPVEALGEARRADLPAKHAGSRGFRHWRSILSAVIVSTPLRVVARRHSCLCVALPPGVYDIAGVAILGLTARVKDPLPDRCPTLVCWLPHGTPAWMDAS
jgi:hypothetical protein